MYLQSNIILKIEYEFMHESKDIKSILFSKCRVYVQQRIDNARNAMISAQEAANDESKSSAGDKYTTDRAMMQLEKEKYVHQLDEATKLSKTMDILNIDRDTDQIELGSLVYTNNGIYFIAISLGKIKIESLDIFVISAASPIGGQLIGKKINDAIVFDGRTITINDIT